MSTQLFSTTISRVQLDPVVAVLNILLVLEIPRKTEDEEEWLSSAFSPPVIETRMIE
jgi:hypothetical protein